ncbi:GNS1/SUR4 family-domain-containing protein [Boeremia exigua]|uniref:GNS1/SUR4 family-domain-containing protein n=1 Tax=Boeremia exigua TaxID=749465 RepID=UPI001E8D86DE|nr:GNS1/SUR4 family-domain-containing protein [Boeremia exigua]KAH6644590.1 GNS1/SUR4 family-domain-containing protein [Boeremia exigua]
MSGAGPSLFPGEVPAWSVFKFPPDVAPPPMTNPYSGEPTLANPFQIPQDLFEKALHPKVPLTIAAVYAVTVTYLNWYNRQHGNKPWRIASHGWFKAFVIAHNVFLAVYSAVTCVAMFSGLKSSFPNWREPHSIVGTVDALCKIHGPRGLGDAVTYNADTNTWGSRNTNIHVGANGLPDTTDVGRMWNEGLAFWGWFFYLSKFYEVLDTAIILAKGKRSTTLQKYHHAGAMLSMWAGMRYMSPPIWMFVQINSGIHAMMYTYYTLSALGYRVPNFVKRTLTTMQITQFLVGASFAALHLFVSYTVPVSVAHKIAEQVTSSVQPSSIASTVSSAVSSVTESASAALPAATGPALAFLWKLIYRAAGDEGLAENIPVPGSSIIPAHQSHLPTAVAAHENPVQRLLHTIHTVDRVVYRTEYQHVPCVDTSGQAFAIYLNLIYLAPLTGLFMRFFVKSYFRRTNPKTKHQSKHTPISKAAGDAMHGVEREIESISEEGRDSSAKNGSVRGRKGVNGDAKNFRSSLSPSNQESVRNIERKANELLQEGANSVGNATEKAKEIAKDALNKANEVKNKAQQQAKETNDKLEKKAQQNADEVNAEREQGENDVASTPADTPSKKKRNRNKNKNKQAQSVESLNDFSDDEHPERKTEKEPEPKDLNNTLDKNEGKGVF